MRPLIIVVLAALLATSIPPATALPPVCEPILVPETQLESSQQSSTQSVVLVEACAGPPPSSGGGTQETTGAPPDYYRDANGTYQYYSNGQLTTAPSGYTCNDSLCAVGADIRFFEANQVMPDGTTCAKTFCLEYRVRHVDNWTIMLGYRYTGYHQNGLEYAQWGEPADQPMQDDQYDLGRPLITGGNSTIPQGTSALHCEVEAWIVWIHATDGSQSRRQEAFECVQS